MQLPTVTQIELLHQQQAPTPAMFEWVYTHCQAVWSIAQQLIQQNNLAVNADLVKVGCLLHDIGVYPLFSDVDKLRPGEKYITHGMLGQEILQEAGMSETVWRFASHHTGVGLTKEAIIHNNLPLPHQDFVAETPEERLVMYADKFHSKDNPLCFNDYDWYKKRVVKFGADYDKKFEALANEFGKPNLEPLAKQYGHIIRQ